MNTFNKHRDLQFRHRIKNHDFGFDERAWEDMEVLLDKSPRRVPKWYFHFNLFLIGVLSICLSCFFPVIIDEVVTPESTEDNFVPEQKSIPTTPTPEQAPDQKTTPEEDKPKAKATMPLNYAAAPAKEGHHSGQQHINTITKTESIPFYSTQHDIVNNGSPAHSIFMDKKAGQISQQQTGNITDEYDDLITEQSGIHQSGQVFPPIANINTTTLEGKHSAFEELNTEIDLPKNKKVTFGAIAGAGIQMMDQAFERPTTMAVAAGAYAHIPVKGRWAVKVEPQMQYSLPQGNSTINSSGKFELDESLSPQEDIEMNTPKQSNVLISIPVMAAYKLSPQTALEAGIVPSYRPSENVDQSKDLAENNAALAVQTKTTLGFAVGLEQKLTKKVAVNVRYHRNLTSPSSLKPDSSVMVSARYKF